MDFQEIPYYTDEVKTSWTLASSPDYTRNVDKQFPYSEIPYIAECKLIKIPLDNTNIEHFDYWGEGRIVTNEGKLAKGFPNCYNVNTQYKLVESGVDAGKKIPNQIPVEDSWHCDTSKYIKDHSVTIVTVSKTLSNSCSKDIARLVDKRNGKVFVFDYDFDSNTYDFFNLNEVLSSKGLICSSVYDLTEQLKDYPLGDHRAFVNISELNNKLIESVKNGDYETAVALSESFKNNGKADHINKIVSKLLDEENDNILAYAFKLWMNGRKDIVVNHFPKSFQFIFGDENVKLIHKKDGATFKLAPNTDTSRDRDVLGEDNSITIQSWKLVPFWINNNVSFKIVNNNYDMNLKIGLFTSSNGVRGVWGAERRSDWHLVPSKIGDNIYFRIKDQKFEQSLRLTEDDGITYLRGHEDDLDGDEFQWSILPIGKLAEGPS